MRRSCQDARYNFIEPNENSTEYSDKCIEFSDVSLCLIDIVGFSKWCCNEPPQFIVNTMIAYNDIINTLLEKYTELTKIELVGDSCLIAGGMKNTNKENNHVFEILNFSNELIRYGLSRNIFKSDKINVRIGIHIGCVFGTFMNCPMKFQLYGDDINTTSRLESSSYPGVIHISHKAMKLLPDYPSIENTDYGPMTMKNLKGINEIESAFITQISNEVLIIEDLKVCQLLMSKYLQNYDLVFCSDLKSGIEMLKSKIYAHVFLDIYDEKGTILENFKEFRSWETQNRTRLQTVTAITVDPTFELQYQSLFNSIIDKADTSKITDIVTRRGSLCPICHNKEPKKNKRHLFALIRTLLKRMINVFAH